MFIRNLLFVILSHILQYPEPITWLRFHYTEERSLILSRRQLMRKHLLLAGFAAAALIPTLAMAQETCEQRSSNRAAGTAIGAVAGALLGSAVAGHGEKGAGAVIGGVGGAIIGNQAARGPRDCAHAYGYYDNDNRWHENAVARGQAYGYYDHNGAWVDGAPNTAAYGANASYRGRSEYQGQADARVRPDYQTRGYPVDLDTRIGWVDQRIQQGRADGSLSRREARSAQYTLNDIRREEQTRSRYGRLSDRDQAALQMRLDTLTAQVRLDRQG
jgi:hypothetical protein